MQYKNQRNVKIKTYKQYEGSQKLGQKLPKSQVLDPESSIFTVEPFQNWLTIF
jgi:hypothetical protein